MPELERSWLIQRLQKPHGPLLGGRIKDNPFSFGGGLVNGGLSGDAMDVLRSVWSFDYMGAAEFEWGAVPKALSSILSDAKRSALIAHTIRIDLAEVPGSWKDKTAGEGEGEVYVLCRGEHLEEITARIVAWATEPHNRLKETTHLNTSLRPSEEWHGDRVGWLELDNGFLFFTDRTMWETASALFGVDVEERAA